MQDNKTATITRTRAGESILATNKVLRNTYLLLSMTFVCSALTAWYAMSINAAPVNFLILIVGYMGLLLLTQALRNSAWGLVAIFAFTGFMGYTLGPILNMYLHSYVNGGQLIMTALGGTGIIFLALSGYALTTRKDFSYLSSFIVVGSIILFLAMIAGIFFAMPALQLAISAGFMLLSAGFILYETGQIINGGETNYIMATITLYVALYNLFISLLQILGAFSGRD